MQWCDEEMIGTRQQNKRRQAVNGSGFQNYHDTYPIFEGFLKVLSQDFTHLAYYSNLQVLVSNQFRITFNTISMVLHFHAVVIIMIECAFHICQSICIVNRNLGTLL